MQCNPVELKRSMAAATHFWQRHRWTALRSLLLVALLHRLHFLAFLAASSPVWLLTAFLLGAVLVHSEPNVPLAAGASEDEDRHLYKKIRHLTGGTTSGSSSASDDDDDDEEEPGGNESSVSSMETMEEEEEEEDHIVVDREVVNKAAAVAWTADDEHSIRSIGSLELERDARLEKLMSRRTMHRNLIDLDVHIPAVLAPRTNSPFDHSPYYGHGYGADMPGSAPSSLSLLAGRDTNPFDIHIQHQHQHQQQRDRHPDEEDTEKAVMLRRHQSFTAGASSSPRARPSRFKAYFVPAVAAAGSGNSNPSSSPSPSSSTDSDHQTQQEAAVKVVVEEEASPVAASPPCTTWDAKGNGMVVAVDVELISDSSDDDMSLQGDGDDATGGGGGGSLNNAPDHSDEDEEDSFEVESITLQVAAGKQQPRVTDVVEHVSPPSEKGQRHHHHHHQQQHKDDDRKDASIVSGSNETLALVEEKEQRERGLTEIREHHILGTVPVIDSSAGDRVGAAGAAVIAAAPTPPATTAAAAGPPPVAAPTKRATAAMAPTPPAAAVAAAGPPPVAPQPQPAAAPIPLATAPAAAAAVGPPPQPAAAPEPRAPAAVASAPPSGKLSSKSKVASKKIDPKKAVFGFFRK